VGWPYKRDDFLWGAGGLIRGMIFCGVAFVGWLYKRGGLCWVAL
jgi:hypothetical protein